MRTVALIVGTRPEVIKMAPVYFALRDSAQLRPVLVATAQHRQMLDQALGAFATPTKPWYFAAQTGPGPTSLPWW